MVEELLNNRYQIISLIQENHFVGKTVWQAIDLQSEQRVIIKRFDFATKEAQWQHYKEIENEISALKLLDHPNIPRYIEDFAIDKSL